MNRKDKLKILLILIVTVSINLFCVFNVAKTIKNLNGNPKNVAYVGSAKDNIDYSVYIKSNPFIEIPVLPSGYSYLTSLIDHIKLSFSYNYKFDRPIDLTYNYLVKATIVGLSDTNETVSATNPVWRKEYIITPQSEDFKVKNEMKETYETDIDLTGYNDLVSSFIADYGIQLGTNLEVEFIVHFKGKINNKTIENEHILVANIPLGVRVFDITTNKNFSDEEKVYLTPPKKKESSYVNIIFSLIIGGGSIFLALYLIRKINSQYRSEYILNRNKILKDYDERLVEVINFVKYQAWETVDVTSFDELINLSNEAFEPIFFWERKQNRMKESWFCILREKVLYRYLLKQNLNDVKKEEKEEVKMKK